MTRQRVVLYGLLAVVAAAAAILSFAALRDLALLCGFTSELAWLLPVVIDAGAAAGSLAWLGSSATPGARGYGRTLALILLGLSVGGNALGHGLQAYRLAPAWWVVVAVSAIAPAVLGALVHLLVLVGRPVAPAALPAIPPAPAHRATAGGARGEPGDAPGEDGREQLLAEDDLSRLWETAPPALPPAATPPGERAGEPGERAGELIAAGAGRRKLAAALDISEHEARHLIATHRNGADLQ